MNLPDWLESVPNQDELQERIHAIEMQMSILQMQLNFFRGALELSKVRANVPQTVAAPEPVAPEVHVAPPVQQPKSRQQKKVPPCFGKKEMMDTETCPKCKARRECLAAIGMPVE